MKKGDNASIETTQADASVTTTSAQILAQDYTRNYLIIQNKGSSIVYLKLDSAHSGNEGIQIQAGQYYEPVIAPVNAIFAKSASGTNTVAIVVGQTTDITLF